MKRAGKIAWLVGPYVGLAVLVWRQATLEVQLSKFVSAASRMLGIAAEDLGRRAQDLHEEAVASDASRN